MDTIYALSSGRPPAAIAVVRVSGQAAFDTIQRLTGQLPPPRRATLRTLRDGDGDVDDAGEPIRVDRLPCLRARPAARRCHA